LQAPLGLVLFWLLLLLNTQCPKAALWSVQEQHGMQMGIMISELNIASQHGDVECTLLSVVVYEIISFHIVESRDRIIYIYNDI